MKKSKLLEFSIEDINWKSNIAINVPEIDPDDFGLEVLEFTSNFARYPKGNIRFVSDYENELRRNCGYEYAVLPMLTYFVVDSDDIFVKIGFSNSLASLAGVGYMLNELEGPTEKAGKRLSNGRVICPPNFSEILQYSLILSKTLLTQEKFPRPFKDILNRIDYQQDTTLLEKEYQKYSQINY